MVLTIPSLESAYTIHTTRAIRGFDHQEYAPLRVAWEVLNAAEGFFWRCIRGAGLAYGASTSLNLEAGLLEFSAYKVCSSGHLIDPNIHA